MIVDTLLNNSNLLKIGGFRFVDKLARKITLSNLCRKDDEDIYALLKQLGLLKIGGFRFVKRLGGQSALSSLYEKDDEKVVFKFLIAPRNSVEIERFKLEYSVLMYNPANSAWLGGNQFTPDISRFIGPETSYPLPTIKISLESLYNNSVYYFAYLYEEGDILDELDTSKYTDKDKISLLHRIASSMHYFNRVGYVHRDLHPGNILLLANHSMDPNSVENDPRVKFLDMGNCQRDNIPGNFIHNKVYKNARNLDEDAVFQDNNRRILSSFVSMPPDFLEKGNNTKNYDSWAFGVYAYKLFFGKEPFDVKHIEDITALRRHPVNIPEEYRRNLNSTPLGLRLILEHLLSMKGENRPSIDAIVRLFSWLVYRNDDFQEYNFIMKVIKAGGYDPDDDWVENNY